MAQSYRALLIGVPSYRDNAIDSLPFISADLAELERALKEASYAVTVHDVNETDRDSIDYAVESFVADSVPGDSLLIFLSGHGIHYNGMDYLVPSGAMTRSADFPARCVPIDFDKYIERSSAGDAVILVDACREGITLLEKGAVNAASWSDRRASQVAERRVAYVYACSPAERAWYASDGNATFSLFSRAFSQVVRDKRGPSTLPEIVQAVQNGLDRLTADYERPVQRVRLLTESDVSSLVLLNRPGQVGGWAGNVHPWVALAQEHVVWDQLTADPGLVAKVQDATQSFVARLAARWEQDRLVLQVDPWHDGQLAGRMTDRIRWLLSAVLSPQKLLLSPAEAALLVIFPFLHESYWAHAALIEREIKATNTAHVAESAQRIRFEQFRAGYGRLCRRAERAAAHSDQAAVAAIGWWLFHFWLSREAESYSPQRVTAFLDSLGTATDPPLADSLLREVLASARLAEMLRNLRTDPSYFAQSDRPRALQPHRLVASATDAEQPLRELLLSYVATAAYKFAIDPKTLSEVIVDHVGVGYSVSLDAMRKTVQDSSWEGRGRTRVLVAACEHPAVDLALRDHAREVDALLGVANVLIDSPHLEPLADMPTHATADRVEPAVDASGTRAYESTGLRFRLAEDRIQELLMGEQLYGDPALAIRELYQNALDACRYRDRRTAFLRKKGAWLPDWSGKIEFIQGTDEAGNPFLECRDNGIGMSMRELTAVFSHAGMQFSDLPEYIEERAAWEAEGITLYPNSRFGIGVLSYFMLADDITVKTCRLDRSGKPENKLEVRIAGPGSLFKVQDLGPGDAAGTSVRLHLRPRDTQLSCTDLLRRILWVSDYEVTATDHLDSLSWEQGELSKVAPIGPQDPMAEDVTRAVSRIDATSVPGLWWCDLEGGILADGLWAGSGIFGAVVNLTGPHLPRLTVDRRQMLSYDEGEVARMTRAAIPALAGESGEVLDSRWLSRLVREDAKLADEICGQAIECGRPWKVAGAEVDISVVGCFRPDETIWNSDPMGESNDLTAEGQERRRIPPFVFDWRLAAWVKAGVFGEKIRVPEDRFFIVAQPSDALLYPLLRLSDQREGSIIPISVIGIASDLTGQSVQETAARLTALGFTVSIPAELPEELDRHDIELLSADFDGQSPWRGSDVIPAGRIAAATAATGLNSAEVCRRLAALGYRVPDLSSLPEKFGRHDAILMSEKLNGEAPWREPKSVTAGQVACSMAATGLGRTEACARLAALGFALPDVSGFPERLDKADLVTLSRDADGVAPWLSPDSAVPGTNLFAAARLSGRPITETIARLAVLGLVVPDLAGLPARPDREDVILLIALQGQSRSAPVTVSQIVAIAVEADQSPPEVCARLAALGFAVPDPTDLPERLDSDDKALLSRDLDRIPPWLEPGLVSVAWMASAMNVTGLELTEICERLAALGFTVPEIGPSVLLDEHDRILLGLNPTLGSSRLKPGPVSVGLVAAGAALTGLAVAEVSARLTALGFTVPDTLSLPQRLDRTYRLLLSVGINGQGPWLEPGPMSLARVAKAAVAAELEVEEVSARLVALGFTVPETASLPALRRWEDSRLMSGINPDQAVSAADIAAMARKGMDVAHACARLQSLGFTLPGYLIVSPE